MPDPTLLLILAFVLVAIGLMGTILPAIPGVPLVFLGLVLAAWAEGFRFVGAGTLTVLGLMALLAYAVDLAAGALGAKKFGASRLAVLGAAIGTLAGLFLGLPGLGGFVGGGGRALRAARPETGRTGRARGLARDGGRRCDQARPLVFDAGDLPGEASALRPLLSADQPISRSRSNAFATARSA